MTDSPRPSADEVLRGWHFVREGRIRTGDKHWNYQTRSWLPVVGYSTFLNTNSATSMGCFIRKDKETQ